MDAYRIKRLFLEIFLIIVFPILPRLCYAQVKIGNNYYLNQDNHNIFVSIKDTIFNSSKNIYIKYLMYDTSKKMILSNCILDKKTLKIVSAYFISNDFSIESYITTENDITLIKVISEGDTIIYNKLFSKDTYPFSFIDLILSFSDIFEKDELIFNSYIFYPQPFKFIAVNKGIEKIKVKEHVYNCYHINVDAKGFLASSISPDLDIWFEKKSKIIIKKKISDSYIIINNDF